MDASCGTCGTTLSIENTLYDERGNTSCQQCLLAAQAKDARGRSARKVLNVAYGAPGIGVVAFVFNPLWLMSLAAVGNGIYVLRSLKHADTAEFPRSVEKAKVAAIAGIVLGAMAGLLYLVRVLN